MIFTNLKKHSQYKSEVLNEIEDAFQYNEENSFAIDFHQLIKDSNLENCHLLLNDNRELIAHIGVRPVTLHYNDANINVLLLGGIFTKKEFQGQGQFKKLYEYICKLYKDKYSMIILWSDKNDFYQKLGFRQFGLTSVIGEKTVTEEEIIKRGYQKDNIARYSDSQLSQLNELYNQSYKNTISIKRTLNDWRDIKQISSMKLFRNKDNNEYLFFEKGQDLKGIIHEVSFSSNKKELKKFKPLQLLNPSTLDEDSFFIHLAWGKIINEDIFSKFIHKLSKGSIEIKRDELKIETRPYQIDQNEILTILFGPGKAQEIGQLLPSIYITGADSI